MIILGIGSNLGDRLANLRRALNLLRHVKDLTVMQVSPVYISDPMLPEKPEPNWCALPYFNAAISCTTTSLEPMQLLDITKAIEQQIGRPTAHEYWSPRLIDIDILAWDERVINTERLKLPHPGLSARPFALWPLADLAPEWRYCTAEGKGECAGKCAAEICAAWGSRFDGVAAPFHTRQISQRIDTPEMVGILNITPDSFSDGGLYTTAASALQQAEQMFAAGADVIDIGAESTRPNPDGKRPAITPDEEWQRLEPVLVALTARWPTAIATSDGNDDNAKAIFRPKISVDTRHAATARRAIEQFKVDWINDVTGGDDDELCRCVAASPTTKLVFMHHLGVPPGKDRVLSMQQDVVAQVCAWGEQRIEQLLQIGLKREQLIFDPGIGFGKAAWQSFALIKRIAELSVLGLPILIGHSRKSFLSEFTDKAFAERDIETAAISALLSRKNCINYLRVHDIEFNLRAMKIAAALEMVG